MLKTQNKNSHIEGRKVLNLCSNNCDSEWLLKNLAHSVYVLEPTKIMEKVKCGEIDTIFNCVINYDQSTATFFQFSLL